ARVQGALPFIERKIEPFLALGEQVSEAVLSGRRDEADRLALGFAQFEDAIGPDLAHMHASLDALSDRAEAGIYENQQLNTSISFALFIAASGLGLGISGVGAARVVGGLRRLVASAAQIEQGRTDIVVPGVTRDEVGELARAFNRMVAELRERERIKETFGKFVDPRIVTRLIGSADESGAKQAERKVVTIFFSDIKGFSGISEQLTAGAMVNL